MMKEAAAAAVLVLLPAVAAPQDAADPQAKGREAVGQACIQCHNLRFLPLERRPAERWRKTVYEMISRGAQVKPEEIEPIVSYLAATFSPQSPSTQAGGQAQLQSLPEGKGRTVLVARCVQCHGVEISAAARKSKEQWVDTIRKMRTLGVTLSADDETVLTAYLAEHFGPRTP